MIGMLTDRDITMRGVAGKRDVSQMTAREAMSAEVLFCFGDDQVEQAATIMSENHVHRLAVLDREDRHLIGVISLSDMGGSASQRRPYEVIFHKIFTDHRGHPHRSELTRVSVAQGTKAEAIATAISQFEEMNHLMAWHQLADGYDVTSVRVDEGGATIEEREPTSERGKPGYCTAPVRCGSGRVPRRAGMCSSGSRPLERLTARTTLGYDASQDKARSSHEPP